MWCFLFMMFFFLMFGGEGFCGWPRRRHVEAISACTTYFPKWSSLSTSTGCRARSAPELPPVEAFFRKGLSTVRNHSTPIHDPAAAIFVPPLVTLNCELTKHTNTAKHENYQPNKDENPTHYRSLDHMACSKDVG